MKRTTLSIIPVPAPVQSAAFSLIDVFFESLTAADAALHDGDVVAISSKYTAISEGRVVALDSIRVGDEARRLAERYQMNPVMAQLVLQEADHIFGGIPGFLLTQKDGIIAPNAGIDRSNIPHGYAVLFPQQPYQSAARIRAALQARTNTRIGVILTDSWLMPGRLGTTGVALATSGFQPLADERGKPDLFGNPLVVTRRSITDQIVAAAELVMGERDEATPFAIVRGAEIVLTDTWIDQTAVMIPWHEDIYVQSLTGGLLPDGFLAPRSKPADTLTLDDDSPLTPAEWEEVRPLLDAEGRVRAWSAKARLNDLAVAYLAGKFSFGRTYTEKEVNAILNAHHLFNDPALLRRTLYEQGYLNRTPNGAEYWRTRAIML
ncbi:MAG: coenzyme F420-0:L-glutamate ligase [bacterium]|nr:coenzyme F420-0:L-glutamate ligase [bacterium]